MRFPCSLVAESNWLGRRPSAPHAHIDCQEDATLARSSHVESTWREIGAVLRLKPCAHGLRRPSSGTFLVHAFSAGRRPRLGLGGQNDAALLLRRPSHRQLIFGADGRLLSRSCAGGWWNSSEFACSPAALCLSLLVVRRVVDPVHDQAVLYRSSQSKRSRSCSFQTGGPVCVPHGVRHASNYVPYAPTRLNL